MDKLFWNRIAWGLFAGMIAMRCVAVGPALAAGEAEIINATAIPKAGLAGATVRVRIQITSHTSDGERKQLLAAFQKSADDGMALLRTMTKGYVNVEGQPGQTIGAVFAQQGNKGTQFIILGEHRLSKLERSQGKRVEDYPVAGLHLEFDATGNPVRGELFPAVRLKVTEDGFVDFETDASNKVTLHNITRR